MLKWFRQSGSAYQTAMAMIGPKAGDRLLVAGQAEAGLAAELARVTGLNGQLVNDERVRVPFEAVVSVPCFELWLLLHFEDVLAPLHRDEALARLRLHVAGYTKGQGSHWAVTRERLDVATARANALMDAGHTAEDGTQPYTRMHELVHRLLHLKDQAA